MKTSTETAAKTKTGSQNGTKTNSKNEPGDLVDTFQSLKEHLGNLEREQNAIRAELSKRRKNRAQNLQEIRETRASNASSMGRLQTGLKTTLSQSRKQQKYLRAMRQVQKQNETSLDRIARRLDGLEILLNERPVPVNQLKTELLTMLGDLQQIRKRRKKVEISFNSP